jgi:hypothetical protein
MTLPVSWIAATNYDHKVPNSKRMAAASSDNSAGSIRGADNTHCGRADIYIQLESVY